MTVAMTYLNHCLHSELNRCLYVNKQFSASKHYRRNEAWAISWTAL